MYLTLKILRKHYDLLFKKIITSKSQAMINVLQLNKKIILQTIY